MSKKDRDLGQNILRFPGFRMVNGKYCKDGLPFRTISAMLNSLPDADYWRTSAWIRQQYAYMEQTGRIVDGGAYRGGRGGAA